MPLTTYLTCRVVKEHRPGKKKRSAVAWQITPRGFVFWYSRKSARTLFGIVDPVVGERWRCVWFPSAAHGEQVLYLAKVGTPGDTTFLLWKQPPEDTPMPLPVVDEDGQPQTLFLAEDVPDAWACRKGFEQRFLRKLRLEMALGSVTDVGVTVSRA